MNLKKIVKPLLFPHIAVMVILVPFAVAALVYSLTALESDSVVAIISYVLSAYTLTVWCVRIPNIIKWAKTLKNENKYLLLWSNDPRLRVKVTLYGSLGWNTSYGFFQLCLGIFYRTFWFSSLGIYHICLAVMRFFLVRHTKYAPGERMKTELEKYRACGIVLLVMNLALALIVFFMVYFDRTFKHHKITAIAMAAYAFTALTASIINVVEYRKYNSPVFSASKAIGLASALVSMLTLESTMLTAFADQTMTRLTEKWLLGATGASISAVIVAMAIYMIAVGTSKIKKLKSEVENGK